MSSIAPDRIDWVERQLLAGGDLRAALRFLDARRARHTRGSHNTWGIALGLRVEPSRRANAVEVTPGFAYDRLGRELLLPDSVQVRIPAEAGASLVTIAARSRGTHCVPVADVRAVWPRTSLDLGLDVPLAEVDLGAGTVDDSARHCIRSLAPPRVAGGVIPVGGAGATGGPLAFSIVVATGSAGFETTPIYLVQPLFAAGVLPATGYGPFLTLRDTTPEQFVVDVRFGAPTQTVFQQIAAGRSTPSGNPFPLAWLGVEPAPAAELAPTPPPMPCLL